ncbi:MAG: hypothetical protein HZA88_19720 [Verrucomicrobia bacterium]|nr:hypothetical protein [Verrucomicrobiota bacterium]
MIAPSTGEISFTNGLRIRAHSSIQPLLHTASATVLSSVLSVEGWHQHLLGDHPSNFGHFAVEVSTGTDKRVEAVYLSHAKLFYKTATREDSERRAFHELVIASDLHGQLKFPWGHVFCCLDKQANRDWLVVIYSPSCSVPMYDKDVCRVLRTMGRHPTADQHAAEPLRPKPPSTFLNDG